MLRDSTHGYGKISRYIHWLHAVCVFGLFALGYWMVGLDYYHSYYKLGPDIHRAVGVLLLITLVARFLWRRANADPKPIASVSQLQHRIAHGAHYLLYILVTICCVSGYLISTADGRSVEVFNWFAVPALPLSIDYQEEIAGTVHYYATYALVALALLHGLAALKHHFIDKNDTLRRMLSSRTHTGSNASSTTTNED